MADNDPVDINDILELKKINEKLRNEVGTRDVTLEEYRAAKDRSTAIGFDDPKSKGELVPFGQEQSPPASPERGGLRKLLPLLRRIGSRINPALGLADLAVSNFPSEEEFKRRSEKVASESRSGLQTIIDLVKGKNPNVSRRDFLKGIKTAGQMAATPNLPLNLEPKKDPWKTVEAGITINKGLPQAAADKIFNLWKKPSSKIFRNIYFTGDTTKIPEGAVSMDSIQDFRNQWKEGIKREIEPDELTREREGEILEEGVYNNPRLIPDYNMEWDNNRGTSVFTYEDPPTKEEVDTVGKGTWSRYEALIDHVYNEKKPIQWEIKIDPFKTIKEGKSITLSDFMNDSDKEFVKFIRSMKDQGITRDEIYDLWKLGAKRYLDNYLEKTTGFYPLDEEDDWTNRSGGVIRNPYSYAPRDI